MTRLTAVSPTGTAWFTFCACGSVVWGMGGNQPVAQADAVYTAYLALARKRPDQAVAVLRRAGFVVEERYAPHS